MSISERPALGQATTVGPSRHDAGCDDRFVRWQMQDYVARISPVHHRYAKAQAIDAQCRRQSKSWLSPREHAELFAWRDFRRQRAWLRGRMLGKQLIRAKLRADLELAKIEILARDGLGRPRIWCDSVEQPWSLSISHTDYGVLAAICGQEGVSVGVDITPCEVLRDSFIRLWFTPAEIAWLRQTASAARACFLWAAKEALYKACNQGESFDPRQVEVLPQRGCRFRRVLLKDCRLQSWSIDGQIAALAKIGPRTNTASNQQQPTMISASL